MNRVTLKNLLAPLAALGCVASLLSYCIFYHPVLATPQFGLRTLQLTYHDDGELLWGFLPCQNGMAGIAQDFFLHASNPFLSAVTFIALCGAIRYIWLTHRLLFKQQRHSQMQCETLLTAGTITKDQTCCDNRSGVVQFYRHMTRSQNAMTLSVTAAAFWPWINRNNITFGAITAVILCITALMVIWPNASRSRHRPTGGAGLYAGWALVVTFVTLAELVTKITFISNTLIVLTATACLAIIGPFIQVRIGPRVGFSTAVIASLIGMAAIAIPSDPTASVASVIGITSMTIALVSVSD